MNPNHSKHVQRTLQIGLGLAFLWIALGFFYKLITKSYSAPSLEIFELLRPGFHLGDRMIAFGILILAMTPLIRVIVLTILWIKEKDWKFVAVALTVLLTLALSIGVGFFTDVSP